ncbi:hypothetical protein KF840_11010 [bacterium]|nr:hypothetical protein [bacterium]
MLLAATRVAAAGDLAVVVDNGSNRVLLVDPAAASVVRQIFVGNRRLIADIALSPDGETAFVTSGNAQSVYAVDIRSGAVRRNQIGGGPVGIAISPDGLTLFVALIDAASVAVMDTGSLAVLRTLPVPREPVSVALDASGNRLFSTHFATDTVTAVDVGSGTWIGQVDVGASTQKAQYGRYSDRVYVTTMAAKVASIDPLSLKVDILSLPQTGLYGAAESGSGLLVLAAAQSQALGLFVDAGALTLTSVLRMLGEGPGAVAFDSHGDRAYLTSFFNSISSEEVSDGVLSVVDVAEPRVLLDIRRVGRAARAVAISNVELPCGDGTLAPGEGCDDGNRVGGDGCALNCTREVARVFEVRPEESRLTLRTQHADYEAGVRGSMVLRTGGVGPDGMVPVTIATEDVAFEPIPLPGVGCACLRPGTPPETYGRRPAAGDIGCSDAEVLNVHYSANRLHDRAPSDPDCEGGTREGPGDPHPGICNGFDTYHFIADDSRGSGVIEAPLRFDLVADGGTCAIDPTDPRKGADGRPCTADDPGAATGTPLHAFTTGSVLARVVVADLDPAAIIGVYLGGQRFDCVALAETTRDGIGGVRLASGLPLLHVPSLGDAVLSLVLQAHSDEPPTPTPSPTPFPTPSGPAFQVVDAFPGSLNGLDPRLDRTSTVALDGFLYLPMRDADGPLIWRSDGSEAGTVPVLGATARPALTDIRGPLVALGHRILFAAIDAAHGEELWRLDTASGESAIVADIRPGAAGSGAHRLGSHRGIAYFVSDDGEHGYELWRSDGTAAGTAMVADIAPGAASANPTSLVWLDDVALFSADDGVSGRELWRTDGTPAGTWMVRDIVPGAGGSFPGSLIRFGQRVFFSTQAGGLWASDGTMSGTTQVAPITLSPDAAVLGDWLIFEGLVDFTTPQLWRTDGTAAGTTRVTTRELNADTVGLSSFTEYNGNLYFSAAAGVHGREIWKTDGTDAGTRLLKDIAPGPGGEQYNIVQAAAGWLFIAGDDGQTGREVWVSDGSEAGTRLLQDIAPGPFPSLQGGFFTQAGAYVFFAADDHVRNAGSELWAVRSADLGTPPSSPTPTPTRTPARCAGDCNGDGVVSIDELIAAVAAALSDSARDRCPAADTDGDGGVSMAELISAVARALEGCPGGR